MQNLLMVIYVWSCNPATHTSLSKRDTHQVEFARLSPDIDYRSGLKCTTAKVLPQWVEMLMIHESFGVMKTALVSVHK